MDLLSHADAMSKAASDFELAASGRSDRISGSVCITASMAFSSQFLPSILTKLRDQEPDLEIELIASDESGNLLLREADIAVRMFQPTQPDLIARKVGHIEMGAFASTEYLEHFGTPRDLSELKNHVVIGTLKRDYSRQVLRELGLETNSSFFKLRCDDPNVAWQMVLAGYGIGFTHLEFGVREPSVQRVGENLPTVTLPIWLTSHAQLRESKSIRRVFDFLAEEITSISNQ
ncbi:MAG: LysR substrate-binding domain-containing protein [Pseudomonadota bacterium]